VKVRLPGLTQILESLSDDKSLALFNTIAISRGNSSILITRLGLTRKQYYSKITKMTRCDLIKRSHGTLMLTTFGKIIYEAHLMMGRAIECYWKLRAVDSLDSREIPREHYGELVQAITGHREIASYIIKSSPST
jgi:predicted transcriptional regulator